MNSKFCYSGCNDDEKNEVFEDPEWYDPTAPDRKHVDALLAISEEETLREQDLYRRHNETGWEEAFQGWGQSSDAWLLFCAQKKGRKVKSDNTESHCVLCADLKNLKLSELPVSDCAGTSSESSSQIAKEPLKNTIPDSSSSTSEEGTSDVTTQEGNVKSDPLNNKLMLKNYQCIHNKILPYHLWVNAQCPCPKDRGAKKATLVSSFIVLPPVKPHTSGNLSPNFWNKRESRDLCPAEGEANPIAVGGATGPVNFGEKLGVNGEKAVIPYGCSADTCQGSLTSKHGPSQHHYRLLSIPVSKKGQLSFTTFGDTLPRASLRHSSGHRLHSAFKAKSTRRAEPELPMLLGTRVSF